MLQAIRDKTTGWIAYLIIILISIPFALAGISSYFGGGAEQPLATVNGEEIDSRQLDNAYANYRNRLAQVFGGQIPENFDNELILKEQVLTQLIEEKSLQSYSENQRYRIGDIELNEKIRAMTIFHQDGKFNSDLYESQLRSQGQSPASFEQSLRFSTQIQQLGQAVTRTAFITPVVRSNFSSLTSQQRKIRIVTIKNQTSNIELSEAEISDYYQQQSALFKTEEQLKIDYIELSLETIKSTISVSEDQLLDRYEQNKNSFTSTQIRTTSHILLTLSKDADEQQIEQVEQKIKELKNRIDDGEDFAVLAREHSQDPGSAAEGGSLGEVEKGMMVKPFEDVLFSMQTGQVSDPVKTGFGWHLIKLDSIAGGDTKSFDQARADLLDEIQTELAENQIYDLVENLSNISYEQSDSLLPAAEQLDLKIQTSGWFSRLNGSGIAVENKIREIAFSDEVLLQKRNSEGLELEQGKIIFLRLNQHAPAKLKPLTEVSQEIENILKRNKGRTRTTEIGTQALEQLKKGTSLEDIALANNVEVDNAGFVSRNDNKIDRDVLSIVFSLNKPGSKAEFEGVSEIDGDYSLVELSDVKIPDNSADNKTTEQLAVSHANYDYQAILKTITADADVVRTVAEDQ